MESPLEAGVSVTPAIPPDDSAQVQVLTCHLAESVVVGSGGQELQGFFPRFLSLTLGSGGAPGSYASLIASLQ